LLGEGGMGKVFRAHHRDWNIDLKVNFPKAASFSSAQQLAASQVCKSQAGGNDLETFPWRPNALIEGEFCHECPKT